MHLLRLGKKRTVLYNSFACVYVHPRNSGAGRRRGGTSSCIPGLTTQGSFTFPALSPYDGKTGLCLIYPAGLNLCLFILILCLFLHWTLSFFPHSPLLVPFSDIIPGIIPLLNLLYSHKFYLDHK